MYRPSFFRASLTALLLSGFLAGAGCGPTDASRSDAPSPDDLAARVRADGLRAHVAVLAHDSMRGRDTDDIGYERARDYVVREFRRMGLQPSGGDSYLQPFELLELVSDRGSRLEVGGTALDFPDAVLEPDWLGDTPVLAAPGLYVGHGLVTGEVSGSTLAGKIAFVLAGTPPDQAEDRVVAMRGRAEVELALRAGALAVVVLNPDVSEAGWAARTHPRRPARVLADGSAPYPHAAAQVGPAASRRLLERWGRGAGGGAEAPRTVDVGPVTLQPRHDTRTVRTWNVIGVLPGSDPLLADQAVVFTAHLDHVGIGAPDATGDSIYNGTHDNALGVANVLTAAEALAGGPGQPAARLPRSVVFLLTGAEESGLLGSWHYVNHPVVPLERIVAAINHDGGLADVRTDDVFAWGPEFSTIESDVAQAATESGLQLSHAQRPPFGPSAGLLYRSDHYPFLIAGVPVAYLMPGFTIDGDSTAGREAWEGYLGSIHHRQADDFEAAAAYESPAALTALTLRLVWRWAHMEGMPRTHADAPVRKTRGAPDGFFFGEPPNGRSVN